VAFDTRPLSFFDAFFRDDNIELVDLYAQHWAKIPAHYPPGWCYDFWEPNRFLNRVIYHHLTSLDVPPPSVLDFGCYDGLLVRALLDQCIDAYGWDRLPCMEMFRALGIEKSVNRRQHCEVVVAFGVAQEYRFRDLLAHIAEENAGLPDVLFLDREPTRPTPFNAEYFDPTFTISHGIQVVSFPNCISDRSRAELLIWRKDAGSKN
jgi:hypothetical protein